MSSDGSTLCGVLVATKKKSKKRPDLGALFLYSTFLVL